MGGQSFLGFDLAGLRVWALVRTCVFLAEGGLDFLPLDSPGPPASVGEPLEDGLRPEDFAEAESFS